MGAIPGLVGRQDLLVVDEQAHNSIQEGAKIAKANGTRVMTFSHCDPVALRKVLTEAGNYRCAVVAIDGVYSMSGELPPLTELNDVCLDIVPCSTSMMPMVPASSAEGRGTVFDAPGQLRQHAGDRLALEGLLLCRRFHRLHGEFKLLLKMRSNTYIFGGPVVPLIWMLSAPSATFWRRANTHSCRPAATQSRAVS